MSKETKKKKSSVVRNMMIALVGGLIVGLAFLLLREQLTGAGYENVWNVINLILFQDITADDGVTALGLFYNRTAFYERTAACHCSSCAGIFKPCHVQYLQFFQTGKDRGTYDPGICFLLCSRSLFWRRGGIPDENRRIF